MNTLTKSSPLGTLGLTSGDHWVRFHVEDDAISFEVAASLPAQAPASPVPSRRATAARSFVARWSGQGRLLSEAEIGDDERLAALTAKHVR
ncbi:MAG: hypothetical protein KA004_16530 [Verrucomicrobiales bacterium]|nr:hypothetical protein [Verrucomicrobiales bacterium]